MSQKQDNLIVVLDIGSAHTRVLAGELNEGALRYRGHGVVESAGSLIQATDTNHNLPSGLGSRHAAAAAISVAADCISLVVSSSTGQVTLFRRGVLLPLTEKRR